MAMLSQDDTILCRRKAQKSATLSLSTKFLEIAVCSATLPAPVFKYMAA